MRKAPDLDKAEALAREGWEWSHDLQTWLKNEPASTVDNFGNAKPYEPAWHDNAELRKTHRADEDTAQTANADKLRKIQEAEAKKLDSELKKKAVKNDTRYMSPDDKRRYVNENNLNSNLPPQEALQLRRITAAHHKAKEELHKQNVANARRYGDASAIENLVRIIQNADPREKLLIKQALMGAGADLNE